MSRSESKLETPAKIFLKWSGSIGKFEHFDKTKGEKGEKVFIDLPFTFMVLDTLTTIKGYSDKTKSGFWSNEIRNIIKDTLTVRNKSGIQAVGLYNDVISSKNCVGAKYCSSVYISCKIGSDSIMANIQMMGSALGSWIDFTKTNQIYDGAISVASTTDGQKGATKFKIPVFQTVTVTKSDEDQAIQMDKQLKTYLNAYFERAGETKEESTTK